MTSRRAKTVGILFLAPFLIHTHTYVVQKFQVHRRERSLPVYLQYVQVRPCPYQAPQVKTKTDHKEEKSLQYM